MATIDELKKKDGSAVTMGSVRPTPAAKGFTPNMGAMRAHPVENSFGDAAASSLDARVSQIPATPGAFPAPAADGKGNTEFSRNVGNALSALPGASPVLGAIRGLAGASKVGGVLDSVGAGAGALATKVAPYAVPAAGLGAIAAASQPSTSAQAPAPAIPGTPAALAQSATSPVPEGTRPQATPALDGAAPNPNLVTRTGNSYSGSPNIKGDIELAGTRGGMISAQNNQAAENLARAGGQTRGFGPLGAIRGGGQVSSMDTSAGYAADLKQLAGIEAAKAEQNANMQAQADYAANKVLEGRAMSGNRGALQILNNNARAKIEQRGQDIQDKRNSEANQIAQGNLGIIQQQLGMSRTELISKMAKEKQIADVQAEYMAAQGDPAKEAAAKRKMLALGLLKQNDQQDEYVTNVVTDANGVQSVVATSKRTGQVQGGQQGAQATPRAEYDKLPKGSTYTGTDGKQYTKG